MPTKKEPIWIARELSKCSGCQKCEIACSLFHENRIWPNAPRKNQAHKLYARTPEETTRDLATKMYGEQGKEHV